MHVQLHILVQEKHLILSQQYKKNQYTFTYKIFSTNFIVSFAIFLLYKTIPACPHGYNILLGLSQDSHRKSVSFATTNWSYIPENKRMFSFLTNGLYLLRFTSVQAFSSCSYVYLPCSKSFFIYFPGMIFQIEYAILFA